MCGCLPKLMMTAPPGQDPSLAAGRAGPEAANGIGAVFKLLAA
ncbi:hypothetical protein [Azospirillum endophyticum]